MEIQGEGIGRVPSCNWTKPLLKGHCISVTIKNYKSFLCIRKVVGVYLKKKITTLGNKMPSRFINERCP